MQTLVFRKKIAFSEARSKSTKNGSVASVPSGESPQSQLTSAQPLSGAPPHIPQPVLPANSLDAARRRINGMRLRNFANSDNERSAGPSVPNVAAKRSREQAFGPTDAEGFNITNAKRSKTLADLNQQEAASSESTKNETTDDNAQTTS